VVGGCVPVGVHGWGAGGGWWVWVRVGGCGMGVGVGMCVGVGVGAGEILPSLLACVLPSFLPCGVGMGIGVVVVVSECVFMCRSAMGSSKWHWIHWRVPRLTPPCYF
jgi:hypothetical protein